MRRFERGRRLLLVGSVLAIALFGDGFLTFAQQKAEPELMWEMRFEGGKARVKSNEIARLKREGRVERFPLRTVVNQKDHRVRFFDEDGNFEREENIEGVREVKFSADGKYYGLGRPEVPHNEESPYLFEYKDRGGNLLWKRDRFGEQIRVSSTGESIATWGLWARGPLTFYGKDGQVLNKTAFGGDFFGDFSGDGRYFVAGGLNLNIGVGLFNAEGNILWTKFQDETGRAAISHSGRYIACTPVKLGSTKRLVVLDTQGNILWEKSGSFYNLSFSHSEQYLSYTKGTRKASSPVEVCVSDVRTGEEIIRAKGPFGAYDLRRDIFCEKLHSKVYALVAASDDKEAKIDLYLLGENGQLLWEQRLSGRSLGFRDTMEFDFQSGLMRINFRDGGAVYDFKRVLEEYIERRKGGKR